MSAERSHDASPPEERVAPRWHTAALIALIVGVAASGAVLQSRGATLTAPSEAGSRVAAVYLPMIVVQWGLLLYVCRMGRPRWAVSALLGRPWNSPARAAGDVALAAAGWLAVVLAELSWTRSFGAAQRAAVLAMLPSTWTERLAWVVVAVSVGFCEEIVYRGYLQTQLTAFTGRTRPDPSGGALRRRPRRTGPGGDDPARRLRPRPRSAGAMEAKSLAGHPLPRGDRSRERAAPRMSAARPWTRKFVSKARMAPSHVPADTLFEVGHSSPGRVDVREAPQARLASREAWPTCTSSCTISAWVVATPSQRQGHTSRRSSTKRKPAKPSSSRVVAAPLPSSCRATRSNAWALDARASVMPIARSCETSPSRRWGSMTTLRPPCVIDRRGER